MRDEAPRHLMQSRGLRSLDAVDCLFSSTQRSQRADAFIEAAQSNEQH